MKKFIYILCTIFVLLVGKTVWASNSNPWVLDPTLPLAYQIETSNNLSVIEVCDTQHGNHSNCKNAYKHGFNSSPVKIQFFNGDGSRAYITEKNNQLVQCQVNSYKFEGNFSSCFKVT